MNFLWTSADMVATMDGRPIGQLPEGVAGISIDTRTMEPGEAFFAIKGEQFDGHDFVTSAMAAGAGVAVVAKEKLPALGKSCIPMIVLDDVLQGLVKLGIAARARSRAKIIAVTGSVGKTTTKAALRHVLSETGKVHVSVASFNNHWGVPLMLARMPVDVDYGVFEIGMNHANEIRPLVNMVRPHIAIITMIAPAHLGHFSNLEEIATAKAEIFEAIEPDGYALLNRDDTQYDLLKHLAKQAGVEHIRTFGENSVADYHLSKIECFPNNSSIMVQFAGQEISVKVGAPGRHIVQNMLAVLGAAHLVGVDITKASRALETFAPESGRGTRYRLYHPTGMITLIDESYNANPTSMRAALDLLYMTPPESGGRRIAVLGDMLELGKQAPKLHRELADLIKKAAVNALFIGGSEMSVLKNMLPVEIPTEYRGSVEELQPLVLKAVCPGDVIMIKSSKGIRFSKIVEALINQYPPITPLKPVQ